MRDSKKSFEDAGTQAAMQAASATELPNIDEYRTHAASLPKLSVIALTRCGFGPTPEAIADFESMGVTDEERLSNWLDKQLNPDSIADADCDARIQAAGFTTPGKTLRQAWQQYADASSNTRRQPVVELERLNFMRAAHSNKQLFEVLVVHYGMLDF